MYQRLPADDPQQRQPDITLANRRLGWMPSVSLKDGLQKTIAYFDNVLSKDEARIDRVMGEL